MVTINDLVRSTGLDARAVRYRIKKLGLKKTGRDYVLTEAEAAMVEQCPDGRRKRNR